MKLAVNTVIFGLNGAVSEGLVLAERSGIDAGDRVRRARRKRRRRAVRQYKRASFLEPETTPVAFALALADKDLRLISEQAAATGTPMPQAAVNLAAIQAAERSDGDDADFSRVASHLREEGRR